MAARRAILEDPQALDCTLYRADEEDADAEEEDLGDARIRFAGAFRAPAAWGAAACAEYFGDDDPGLFSCAYIECVAAVSTAAFFTAEVGDYVAVMTAAGQVEMFFVHDCSEDEAGRLCVLIRDDEPLF
ncbi:hypothetical protein [Pseudomonas sp. N040]|uniref:hypothetical protein n=1 Tax=Pseudomonas sp. N040 TaxID=2785325 RepID=UPI0018A25457|nr:hypothetical protein [Pseudomonas sp. N040]MBF7730033.1 hypothetical protein [Pseudomonas sp. N040]MBW7013675.1 hypothetical protein [Pseudomonas sp. N040]